MEYLNKYMIPDVSNIVIDYCLEYKLLDWVEKNLDKLNWDLLSGNKNAIELLNRNNSKEFFQNINGLSRKIPNN
jgi:hypothetical protein